MTLNNKTLLTEKQEKTIIDGYLSGLSENASGRLVGVSRTVVWRVLNDNEIVRRKWWETRRKYNFNENYFDVIDSEDKAYWLGFLMADGNTLKRGYRLALSLGIIDKEHIQKFLNCIDSDHPIKVFLNKRKDGYNDTWQARIDIT